MTKQDQQKALAELDGWKLKPAKGIATEDAAWYGGVPDVWTKGKNQSGIPNYLTSYDAIIPLIQKQTHTIQCFVMNNLEETFCVKDKHENEYMRDVLNATPQQLCQALLRATNLWKE